MFMSDDLNIRRYRVTTPVEKAVTSLINISLAFVFLIPFIIAGFEVIQLKLILTGLFFIENLISLIFNDYRLPGMVLQKTYWLKQYSKSRQLIHSVLYTASFSTILFWIWIPGDLLVMNLLLLQLPCVMATKMTLHGLLAGYMMDVKQR
jgi:hypothetical protein